MRKSLGIDREDIKLHIDNIVRSLNTVQHITGNLTKMENICTNTKDQMEDLRKTISSELDQMLIKSTKKDKGDTMENTESCKEEKIVKKSRSRKGK